MFSAAVRKYAITRSQSQRDNSGTANNIAAVSSVPMGRTKMSKLTDIPARSSKDSTRSRNHRSSSNSSKNNNRKEGGYYAPPCSSQPSVAVKDPKATQAADASAAAASEVRPGYYLVPQSFTFTVAPGSQPPISQLTYDSALTGPVAHSRSIDGGYHGGVGINTNRSSSQATMASKQAHERNDPPMGQHSLSFSADHSLSKYSKSMSASLPPPKRDGTGSIPTIRKSFWTREQLERANIASKVATPNATGAPTLMEATVKKQAPLPPLSHPNLFDLHYQHRSSGNTTSNSEEHMLLSSLQSDNHCVQATFASDRPPLDSLNYKKQLLYNPLARRSWNNDTSGSQNNSSSIACYTNSPQRSISSVRAASTTNPSSLHPSWHTKMKRVLNQTKIKIEEKNHELQVQLSKMQEAHEFMQKKVDDASAQKNQELQEQIDKKMKETQEILFHNFFEQQSSVSIKIQNEVNAASSKFKNDVEEASAAAFSKIRNDIEQASAKIQLKTMHGVSKLEESCAAKITELHKNIRSIKHDLLKSALGYVEKHCGRWFTSFLSMKQEKEQYSQSSGKSHQSKYHKASISFPIDNKENNDNHKEVDVQLTPANKTCADTSRRIISSNKKPMNRHLESFQNHHVNTTRLFVSATKSDFHTLEVLSPETSYSNMSNFTFAGDSQRGTRRRQSENFFSCKKTKPSKSSKHSLLSSSQESTREIILNSKRQHIQTASHDDSTQQWLISTPASRTLETDRKIKRGSQSTPKRSPLCPLILTSVKNQSHFSEVTTTPTLSQRHSGHLLKPKHNSSKRKAEDITRPSDPKRLVRGKNVMKKSRRGLSFYDDDDSSLF